MLTWEAGFGIIYRHSGSGSHKKKFLKKVLTEKMPGGKIDKHSRVQSSSIFENWTGNVKEIWSNSRKNTEHAQAVQT